MSINIVDKDGNLLAAAGSPQIVDSLDSTESTKVLSANQGKILNEKIEAINSFESDDNTNPTSITDIDVITNNEEPKSLFKKLSTLTKNVRYIIKLLGDTDLKGKTITQAINDINITVSNTLTNNFIRKIGSDGPAISGSPTTKTITVPCDPASCAILVVANAWAANNSVQGSLAFISASGGAYMATQMIIEGYPKISAELLASQNQITITATNCSGVVAYNLLSLARG